MSGTTTWHMRIRMMLNAILAVGLLAPTAPTLTAELSDDQVRDVLIDASVRNYPGNCPCPDNRDVSGRRCGKRSAYSKPGGYSPLCYRSDVTKEMIERFRHRRM